MPLRILLPLAALLLAGDTLFLGIPGQYRATLLRVR